MLGIVGVALVWAQRLKSHSHSRYALLAALLTVVAELWLSRKYRSAADYLDVDHILTLGITGIFSYVLIWICIRRVFSSRAHVTDLQESSMLSMLYVGSRHDAPDFEATVLAEPHAPGDSKTEAAPRQ